MEILNERELTHGNFILTSSIAQAIKSQKISCKLNCCQAEAFDLIATKLARIMAGNHNEIDHWQDIAGYATLVVNQLKEGKGN